MHDKEHFQCKFNVREGTCIIFSFPQMKKSRVSHPTLPRQICVTQVPGEAATFSLIWRSVNNIWLPWRTEQGKGDLWLHRNLNNWYEPGFSPCFAVSLKISHTHTPLMQSKEMTTPLISSLKQPNHQAQSNHLISTELDPCSHPNAGLCVPCKPC